MDAACRRAQIFETRYVDHGAIGDRLLFECGDLIVDLAKWKGGDVFVEPGSHAEIGNM